MRAADNDNRGKKLNKKAQRLDWGTMLCLFVGACLWLVVCGGAVHG